MSKIDIDAFDVLQVLRIKGVAEEDALASALGSVVGALAVTLADLEQQGLVNRATAPLSGWALTAAGVDAHGEIALRRRSGGTADVELGYQVFLDLNGDVKQLMSDWVDDPEHADALLDELEELQEQAAEGFEIAARQVPRFGVYVRRLSSALELARAGDGRFVADPRLPSYHTVWFESHEDFLLTLGRSRAEEGST